MSYHHPHTSTIQQFVPSYVVKSDYLPTRVCDGNDYQTQQLLRQYEEQRRHGRVFTHKPAEFNPNRYVSYRVYQNVHVNEPISQEQFSRIARR